MTGWELASVILAFISVNLFLCGVAIGYKRFNILSRIKLDRELFFVLAFFCLLITYFLELSVLYQFKTDCQRQIKQISAVIEKTNRSPFERDEAMEGWSENFQVFLPGLEASERAMRKDACVMKGMRVWQ